MRTFLNRSIGLTFAASIFTITAITITACGSNEKKTSNKAPAPLTAVDQAQKVMVQDTRPLDAAPVAAAAQPEPAETRVRHTLVLSEGKTGFKVNSTALSDEAKALIDEMFTSGAVDMKDAKFEIEGHTDNLGTPEFNEKVCFARAEAVRQYLSERYEVAMESISVISYGLEKPVADNNTPEGRKQNRRVVIRVVD